MAEAFSCDYCHATIDTTSDAALITRVHRHVDAADWGDDPDLLVSGQHLTLRFCSQQHMGTYMERIPLPAATPEKEMTFASAVSVVLLGIVALAAVAVWVYGIVALVRDFD